MRQYNYIGTITFNSYHDIARKWRLVDDFANVFNKHLKHTLNSEYILTHSIEYHKVAGQDDPDAPHIHFILNANVKISKMYFTGIIKMFNEIYGRTQLYLATPMKLRQWTDYITKDVAFNDTNYNRSHYYETRLEPLNDTTDADIDELIDYEDI